MPKDELPGRPSPQPVEPDADTSAGEAPTVPTGDEGHGYVFDADTTSRLERLREFRDHAADLAETMADQADSFASYLEESARRGDSERRLKIAEVEREIAEIERRNAAKLRSQGSEPMDLERLPSLPGTEAPTEPE